MKTTLLAREARCLFLQNTKWQHSVSRLRLLTRKVFSVVLIAGLICLAVIKAEAQPGINSTPVTTATENVTYTYKVSASDPGNLPLTFSATTLPGWLTFTPGGNTPNIIEPGYIDTYSLAIDDNGNTYYTDINDSEIYKIAPDGTKTFWAARGMASSFGMLADDNYLYLSFFDDWSCQGLGIVRYQLNNPGAGPQTVLNSSSVGAGMGMAVRNGYLYFSNYSCGKIGRINLATLVAEPYINGIFEPWAIDFAPNGDLYVTTQGNGILKYDSGQTTNPVIAFEFYGVYGIAFDNLGNLYTGDGNQLLKYAPDLGTYEIIDTDSYLTSLAINNQNTVVYGFSGQIKRLEGGAILSGTPGHEHVGTHTVQILVTNGTESFYQDFVITVSDPNAPLATGFSPGNNSVDISVDTVATVKFNETILKGSGNIYIKSVLTDGIIQTINIDSNAVSINDSILIVNLYNLPPDTEIYITIDPGAVIDLNGNLSAGIADYYTWSFTTIAVDKQFISFAPENEVIYGVADYFLNAVSTSGLPVTYSSSDEEIASVINDILHVRKAGVVSITAYQAGNDDFQPATPVEQTLTILKKELTLTLSATPVIVKEYNGNIDAQLVAENYIVDGLIEGDSVEVSGFAEYDNKNADTGKIVSATAFVLNGKDADNYYIGTASAIVAARIIPKNISVSLIPMQTISKVYDGSDSAFMDTSDFMVTGKLGSDTITISATTKYDDKHAGNGKPVTATGFKVGGPDSSNYIVATTSAITSGNVLKKNVVVTAHAKSRIYGNPDPVFTYDVNRLESGDVLSGTLGRDNNKNTGKYAITIGTLSGGNDYNIDEYKSDTLTITPAALIITAEDRTRQQGKMNPDFNVKYTGLAAGDFPANLAVSARTKSTAKTESPIGYYDIIVDGAKSPNYIISFVKGRLTVVPSDNSHIKVWQSSKTTLQIRIFSESAQKTILTLYSQAGQPLLHEQKQLQPGINTFTLPVSGFVSGVYILNAVTDKFEEAQKFKIN